MKQVRNFMFIMIASLATMSLFSFKSASANEDALKNVNVTTYASYNVSNPGDPVYFTSSIIKVVKKVLNLDCKAVLIRIATSIIFIADDNAGANAISAKSATLMANL